MTAVLVASFIFGFFAAGLLSVFWLIAIAGPAALVATALALVEGGSMLPVLAFGLGVLALAQVGFGLGLWRVALTAKRFVPE